MAHLVALGLHDLAVLEDAAAILVDNGVCQAIEVVQWLEVCTVWEEQCFADASDCVLPS